MIKNLDPNDQQQNQQTSNDNDVEDPVGGLEGITDEDDRFDEADYLDNDEE